MRMFPAKLDASRQASSRGRGRHFQLAILLLIILLLIVSFAISTSMMMARVSGEEKFKEELSSSLKQQEEKASHERVEIMEKSLKEAHDQLKHMSEKIEKQEKALNDALRTRPEDKKETPGNRLDTKSNLEEAIADLVTSNELSKSSSDYILLNLLKDHNPPEVYGEAITNGQEEHDRCERYGLKYNATLRNTRRRIFYGSMIADESLQVLAAHAAEAHGLYHTVTLIESNITHTATPRDVSYTAGSPKLRLLQSIFGPKTSVNVDLYYEDVEVPDTLLREDLQRELVLKTWKKNGMTEDDIGIMSDVDEVFTRDFLLAAQTCDVPEFRIGQDCRSPKVVANTLIFESSPECIVANRKWFHPDMVIGECIDGIGSAEGRATPKRVSFNGMEGRRENGHGRHQADYENLPKIDLYALWKTSDMRITEGGQQYAEDRRKHNAFHFHNYFNSLKDLRHKYATYTHPVKNADSVPLGQLHEDVNNVLLCMMNRTLPEDITGKYAKIVMEKTGFDGVDGRRMPLIYSNAEYRKARYEEFRKEIEDDEAKHGVFNYEGEPRKGQETKT